MPYSHRSGVRIYYEVSGEGPAMVLLHPGPFDHSVWLYQVAHFSARFTVINIDMRGHGRSEDVTTPYTLADQAADVLGVLEQEGVTKTILAGVSFCSKVAVLIAAEYPDLLSAMILVGGSSGNPSTNSHEVRNKAYLEQGVEKVMPGHLRDGTTKIFVDSPLGRYLLNIFLERAPWISPMAKVQTSVVRTTTDVRPLLSSIRVPTLVINGEFDNALPGGRETVGLIPGAVHRILPGAGHACCLDSPAVFDAAVVEFLANLHLIPGSS